MAPLALLARAADESSGIHIRLSGDTFSLGPRGLTNEDRVVIAKKWTPGLFGIARTLAGALDGVRNLTRRIVLRERAVEQREATAAERDRAIIAREAQHILDRSDHDACVAMHRTALAELDRRRAALDLAEARATDRTSAAKARVAEAHVAQANAEVMLSGHLR